MDAASGTPSLCAPKNPIAPSAVNGVTPQDAALAFLVKYKDLFVIRDPANELAFVDVQTEDDGRAIVRFQQHEGNLVVEGEQVRVHFAPDHSIEMITGTTRPDAAQAAAVPPKLSMDDSVNATEAFVKSKAPSYDRSWLGRAPSPNLALRPSGHGANLAYAVRLEMKGPNAQTAVECRVDAASGALLMAYEDRPSATATGIGVLGDTKTFQVSSAQGGGYQMYQPPTPTQTEISTFDFAQPLAPIQSKALNSWDVRKSGQGGDGAAVDAYVYMGVVDQFYRQHFKWASYDGKGSTFQIFVHENTSTSFDKTMNKFSQGDNSGNAYWDGYGAMRFGDGNSYMGGTDRPMSASLDLCGHEFTHGVTQARSNLYYIGDSGALNEAISDIFGMFIKRATPPPAPPAPIPTPFLFNDAAVPGGWRDLSNPARLSYPGMPPYPDHMSKAFPVDASTIDPDPMKQNAWEKRVVANPLLASWDNYGVHINSSIINNAWYLMTVGGTNQTSKVAVKGFGWEKSEQLWWKASGKFNRGTTILQAAQLTTNQAKALFGVDAVKSVGCAWVAVGVLAESDVQGDYGVTCYCEDADGGVASKDSLPCCDPSDEGGADGGDQCCKKCPMEGGPADEGGGTQQCTCVAGDTMENLCSYDPMDPSASCTDETFQGTNGVSCTGYSLRYQRMGTVCDCGGQTGDPNDGGMGGFLCAEQWSTDPPGRCPNGQDMSSYDYYGQTVGASCSGYLLDYTTTPPTNRQASGTIASCKPFMDMQKWVSQSGTYQCN